MFGAALYPNPDRAVAQLPGSTGACETRGTQWPRWGVPTGPRTSTTDLHCISLLPAAMGGEAEGWVELTPPPSPFGVSVTPQGRHVHALTVRIDGLPEISDLAGPGGAYVAWATPLELEPVIKLGTVSNGETRLGRLALNKYLLLISAENSDTVTVRRGPLVLRGRSPSALMEAHDLLAIAPSAELGPPGGMSGMAGREPPRWESPPAYPGISMLPGIMALEPRVSPHRLAPGAVAGSAADKGTLPQVRPGEVVDLPGGGTLDLEAGLVRRKIGNRSVVMLAFNGQHPGPMIRVREASTIFVNFVNNTPYPTAIHWHGLRLDNRFDGAAGVTQDPVLPGESFRYEVYFPDAGIYWYHPHHREDIQQELGLYGNMLVESRAPDYHGPANRDVILFVDDILLDGEGPVEFGEQSANYMLMGRFGNLPLVNGELAHGMEAAAGEVIRFHLTNPSNTRTFNLSFARLDGALTRAENAAALLEADGATERLPVKLVASDVSRFEREQWTTNVVMAPAERYVIEARFPAAGVYGLVNHVQGINHRRGVFRPEAWVLSEINVSEAPATPDHATAFETLRVNHDVIAQIDPYRDLFESEPDYELLLTLETDSLPDAIERSMLYDWVYFNPVEWTGTMPRMNWASTGREVRWVLREPATGRENEEIEWRFRVGDAIRIRLVNDRGAFHAMQHPLHIHGQRFLVLSQNGVRTENLVWKDTALLPAATTTDILLELSNPGRWMIHCHIAEHLEAGMSMVMTVDGPPRN